MLQKIYLTNFKIKYILRNKLRQELINLQLRSLQYINIINKNKTISLIINNCKQYFTF